MRKSAHRLYQILAKLDAARIYYTLDKTRVDTVMILAQVPGRHYEIEVLADGQIEVEIFRSNGEIGGRQLLDELLRDFAD